MPFSAFNRSSLLNSRADLLCLLLDIEHSVFIMFSLRVKLTASTKQVAYLFSFIIIHVRHYNSFLPDKDRSTGKSTELKLTF